MADEKSVGKTPNTLGHPINIGAEDVSLYLDGQPYSVQDFDYLRHTARISAQREMSQVR